MMSEDSILPDYRVYTNPHGYHVLRRIACRGVAYGMVPKRFCKRLERLLALSGAMRF